MFWLTVIKLQKQIEELSPQLGEMKKKKLKENGIMIMDIHS
jgi:hypothetical protein